jgi:capsular exopolysaccharide synthesis family protein
MQPIEYLRAVLRRWRLVVVCFLVAGVAGWVTTDAPPRGQTPRQMYRSTVTLVQVADAPAKINLGLAAYLATQGDVAKIAAKQLGYHDDPQKLVAQVTADADSDRSTVTVTATGEDRKQAEAVAVAFTNATVMFLRQTAQDARDDAAAEVRKQLDQIAKRIGKLDATIDAAASESQQRVLRSQRDVELARYGSVYTRVQNLTAPVGDDIGLAPIGSPNTVAVGSGGIAPPTSRSGRALLASLLGLGLGCAAALMLDRVDTRVRTRTDAEDAFEMPVVGEIPRTRALTRKPTAVAVTTQPASAVAEAYRSLRSALHLMTGAVPRLDPHPAPGGDAAGLVLAVTSARAGEGKTTTVANLAAALAEAGRTVLVLDCDFRNPQVDQILDAVPGIGLTDLGEDLTAGLAAAARTTAVRRVRVVSAGEVVDSPIGLLLRIGAIVAEARRMADVVLVDCAPLLGASDAMEVLPHADAVLIVTRVGRTSEEHARRVAELLDRLSVPVTGVVLVGVPGPRQAAGRFSADPSSWPRSSNRPSLSGTLLGRRAPGRRTSVTGSAAGSAAGSATSTVTGRGNGGGSNRTAGETSDGTRAENGNGRGSGGASGKGSGGGNAGGGSGNAGANGGSGASGLGLASAESPHQGEPLTETAPVAPSERKSGPDSSND